MGGCAFIVTGQVETDRLIDYQKTNIDPKAEKKHGRKLCTEAADKDFFTADIGALESRLIKDFIQYLKANFINPWPATEVMMSYLDNEMLSVYLRRDRCNSPNYIWYFQFTASGCAGLAEASAIVASHWFEHWYRDNQARLEKELFNAVGFTADRAVYDEKPPDCIPMGEFGYGLYTAETGIYLSAHDNNEVEKEGFDDDNYDDDEQILVPCHFDVDGGFFIEGANLFANRENIEKVDAVVVANFQPGICYCQLCQPDFQPPKLCFPFRNG